MTCNFNYLICLFFLNAHHIEKNSSLMFQWNTFEMYEWRFGYSTKWIIMIEQDKEKLSLFKWITAWKRTNPSLYRTQNIYCHWLYLLSFPSRSNPTYLSICSAKAALVGRLINCKVRQRHGSFRTGSDAINSDVHAILQGICAQVREWMKQQQKIERNTYDCVSKYVCVCVYASSIEMWFVSVFRFSNSLKTGLNTVWMCTNAMCETIEIPMSFLMFWHAKLWMQIIE